MKYLFIFFSAFLLVACEEENQESQAQEIIDKAIEVAGGEKYRKATIQFNFRDHSYKSSRNGGEFHLERVILDSLGVIRDVVSNT
ncbi:hypothetical protein LZ575_21860 [Antarcticibacterium sp. 1MA-6-2]|uniref:DUF6503 family protein n=1 Tax=Antarcticibacterium sp. 1MA-6-2 TaxID=2908210 RepID=UPI001F17F00F|nr:DUF6503 family protein [Antarcticibacterium sp. 1MA-6-2]UJH91206.1 hypothetical protein LZ575_21860 [Antarcticibacterium sp. 1MA-6-2]